jgi:hypothetical protein
MTSAAATRGLTIAGTDVQQDPIGIFLEIDLVGLWGGPSVRGEDVVVPGLPGRIARNREADSWRLPIRGWISGVGASTALQLASYVDLCATVRTLMDPTSAPVAVVVTLEDGGELSTNARGLPSALWDEPVPGFLARVSFEMEAVEDWVYTPAAS